jgi:hypothetical protein
VTALEERRDREIATARANEGKARQTWERCRAAREHVEAYWSAHPVEVAR